MAGLNPDQWSKLEEWCPRIYLVAGVVLVVYVALLGYQAFVDPTVNFHDNEAGIVGPAGFALGFVGLLGITPSLSEARPRLAKVGAILAAIAVFGWTAITMSGIASQAGVVLPTAIQALGFLGMLGMIVGYAVFGVGMFHASIGPRPLVLLLLAPPVLFVLLAIGNVVTGGTAIGAVFISSGLCLTHLGLGLVMGRQPGLGT